MVARMFFSNDPCEQFKFEVGGTKKCHPALLDTFKVQDLPNLVRCTVAVRNASQWATVVHAKLKGLGLSGRQEIQRKLDMFIALLDQGMVSTVANPPEFLELRREMKKLSNALAIIGGRGGPKQQIPAAMYYVPLRLMDRYSLNNTQAIKITQAIMSSVGYRPIPKGRRFNERLLAKMRIGLRINRPIILLAMRAGGK